MEKVTIYTTDTCHWCHMAKEYFKEKGVKYDEINVTGNIDKQKELVQKSGQFGVPVIFVDDKIILGFDREKINKYLNIN